MEQQIAIYDSHEKAVNAVRKLSESGFQMKHVSLLGKADVIDDHVHVHSLENAKNAPVLIGVGAGALVGLLSGLGVFAIPGFGFLYGAGAVVGAFGGFDLGLVTGGIASLLATAGIKEDKVVRFHEHLADGKFAVVVNGSQDEVKQAENLLNADGSHSAMV